MVMEAEHGLTSMAMNTGRHNGDEVLLVRFYTHAKRNQTRSEAEGRPIFEDTDYIEIMQPGNKDSIVKRPATAMDKNRFAEHFRKYQARQDDEHIDGTMIDQVTWVTRAQCEEMKFLNIRTVEQLAGLSDSNAQGIMGIQSLKAKAVKYLESSKEAATSEALAEQKELNAQLMARLESLEAEKEKPKKRTRTKKADPIEE